MKRLTYFKVSVVVLPEIFDALNNFLFEKGAKGTVEEERTIVAYFDHQVNQDELIQSVSAYLHDLRSVFEKDFDIDISCEEIQDQDWAEEWKKNVKPILIGYNILVKPSWERTPDKSPRIVIEIDPEMAFGSGEHCTTTMLLQFIEEIEPVDMHVLDIGTGTGILAICAIKCGAFRVDACDIDPVASLTAQKNCKKNRVDSSVYIFSGSINSIKSQNYDLICANINRQLIVQMLPRMSVLLKENGTCLLSGILNTEKDKIVNTCKKAGLFVNDIKHDKEWLAFETRKE